jgi:hypothetical protein
MSIQAAGSFQSHFRDLYTKYTLSVASDKLVQKWRSHPMSFWQNQLNFATWCATSGCGVSTRDHLVGGEPMAEALFRFHAYYQTRRILTEMRCPLPNDSSWSATDNVYDRVAYERLCAEFGVSQNTDWRQKRSSANHGLGLVYFYVTHKGYEPAHGNVSPKHYDSGKMSFTHKTTNGVLHISFIKQGDEADDAWSTFILDKSEGFTRAGVERVNDSIRTYVWAVLGAQAQTRTSILGTGTAFDAQKQFLANVEDAINSAVDLPGSIARFQDILKYANSKVDFVFGLGLYMAPSDMDLHIGQLIGYNNLIMIASGEQTLGVNHEVNADPVPPAADTGERGLVTPQEAVQEKPGTALEPTTTPAEKATGLLHTDDRTALVVGAIALGLIGLWLRS